MSPLAVDATGNDLTYRVIGAALPVHKQIGSGFKEEVYEHALVINYLKALGAPIGLLFNFGRRKLEYKRIFPANRRKLRSSESAGTISLRNDWPLPRRSSSGRDDLPKN